MARHFRSDIRSFQSAIKVLNGKQGKVIGHNTTLVRLDNDTVAARLHTTDIVTYHRDGRIIVKTGGYNTNTTRHRINGLTEVGITTKSGTAYLGNGVQFVDGMDVGYCEDCFGTRSYCMMCKGTNKVVTKL